MAAYALVVTSPATCTRPVVIRVSTATREVGSSLQERVEDGVADLVSDLVGVALGHGLRGEQATGHIAPWGCSGCWLIIGGRARGLRPAPSEDSLSVVLGHRPPVSPLGSAVTCGTGIVPNAERAWPGAPRPGSAEVSRPDREAHETVTRRRCATRSQTVSARASFGPCGTGVSLPSAPSTTASFSSEPKVLRSPTSLTTSRSQPLRRELGAAVGEDVVGLGGEADDHLAGAGAARRRSRRGCPDSAPGRSASGSWPSFFLIFPAAYVGGPEVRDGGGHDHRVGVGGRLQHRLAQLHGRAHGDDVHARPGPAGRCWPRPA